MKWRLTKVALVSGAVVNPAMAFARDGVGSAIVIDPQLDRGDVAGARTEPAFQSKGLHVGPVFARPSISVLGNYQSNVFNRPDARADAGASIVPRLAMESDLARHEFALTATGRVRRFVRHKTENSEEYDLVAKGRFDLAQRQTFSASLNYAREIEPRSSAGSAQDAAEPVSFRSFAAKLGARLELGALRFVPEAEYRRADYSPLDLAGGGKEGQAFRDTRTAEARVAIEYDLSGLLSGFAAASASHTDAVHGAVDAQRDSRGRSVLIGLRGEITPVIHGELGIGYQSRNYRSPRFRDFEGPTFRADLQWYATPLLTLRVQARQAFENSGNPQVAGILSNKVTVSAYYDPLRRLRLSVSASVDFRKYREVDARARRRSVLAQAQYLIGPGLSVGAYAALLRQDVRGQAIVNEFTSVSAGFGMTFAL
jgi:hypothetical protein